MKIRSFIFLLLVILVSNPASAEKPIRPNGYYISRSGDTIHGYLRNKDSMYLIVTSENGKRKKFTPSKIRGFNLAGREYIPLHLKEFNTNRFMAVKVKGYCTLYAYEHVDKFSLNGMAGVAGAAVEGGFKANNSGLYLKKEGDDNYYSIPAAIKPLTKFLINHFGGHTKLISTFEKKDLFENVENLVIAYNKWYKYERPSEK